MSDFGYWPNAVGNPNLGRATDGGNSSAAYVIQPIYTYGTLGETS
jgi:hypothetical protein